ncbi:organic hydroperoxide resistance protein [Actinorhabdospora filicis]|uniref:Organic hydroperoxide resistance protein n=1 Tax=Actinorhabdospora filicis TaxID=1785913 RepID=A0A9W6SG55_9ACTN|nr:organic hydroperoxide resistance protein [Actinorhabdospora filicis]GLZ76540.1 organic hydroperoxide resistance protein [Actinorhabdospora filicis]
MKVLYTARATATGEGRSGAVATDDGLLKANLAVPADLGGPGGATNPEQLFAAGYAACFHSALQTVARRAKVELGASEVTAEVGIGPSGPGYGLTAALVVSLPDVPREIAEDLVAKAHQVCPYSNATRGNIDVALTVKENR